MKILQIMATSGGGVGGLEQHTFNLVNALAEQHEVHFLALEHYAHKVNQNVKFHAFDFTRSRLNPILLWQLLDTIKRIQPDVIHAQAGKASELLKRIRSFIPAEMKIVTTVHGTKKNKSIYSHADAVIAVSQALTQGIPAEKSHVIYNGVHPQPCLDELKREQLNTEIQQQFAYMHTELKTVICIGRLEPVKNIQLLIQAMQGVDANLWVVGDGSLSDALKTQVQQLGMQSQVAFWGFRTDARDLLQLTDVVALSSEREGFPLVMVEALQANKVMVSTKVNGVVEWLPKSHLAELNDVEQLRAALIHALNLNAEHLRIWQELCQRAQQELTVSRMAEKTLAVYQQLLVQSR